MNKEFDEKACEAAHHPGTPCPHCEHCGHAHCSLNAMGHVGNIFWEAISPPVEWPKG